MTLWLSSCGDGTPSLAHKSAFKTELSQATWPEQAILEVLDGIYT